MIEVTQVSVAEGIRYAIFGQRFTTREAAEKFRDERAAKLNKLAGRQLTDRELLTGPAKPDTRRAAQRAADENWKVVTGDEEVEPDDNPFRKSKERPAPNAREAIRRKSEAEWDARRERAEQQAERDADPERQRAIKFAAEALERARYSSTSSYSDVVKAEQLLAQAKTGALEHFRVMADNIVAKEVDRYAEQRAAAEKRLLAEKKLLEELPPPMAFAAAPGVGPGDTVTRWRGGKDGEEVVVLSGNIIKHKWPAAEAPAEIAALAPEFKY